MRRLCSKIFDSKKYLIYWILLGFLLIGGIFSDSILGIVLSVILGGFGLFIVIRESRKKKSRKSILALGVILISMILGLSVYFINSIIIIFLIIALLLFIGIFALVLSIKGVRDKRKFNKKKSLTEKTFSIVMLIYSIIYLLSLIVSISISIFMS